MGSRSGGEKQYMPMLSRAAVAVGVDGVFMEVHPDPDKALSDGPNMLRVDELVPLLRLLKRLDQEVRDTVQAETFESRPMAPSGLTLVNLPGVRQ
jgi:2-dehydro-3-deoxyphosphooctonate aldolase (KDO 8-P synthase)